MFNLITWTTTLISAVGAINWGLSEFFGFDLVRFIDAKVPLHKLDRMLYAIIAVSGVYVLLSSFSFA